MDNNIKPFTRSTPIWVYDKDETLRLILDPKGDIPHYDSWFREQINGAITLEFTVPATDPQVRLIENDGRAVVRDREGNLNEFIIREPNDFNSDSGPTKEVFAEGGDYELVDEWMSGYKATNVTLETALSAVMSGTRYTLGTVDDFGTESVDIDPTNVKDAIHQLLSIFGGERRFRVEAKGNEITTRYIDILTKRGEDNGKRFEHGKDVEDVRRTIDSRGVKTALYGYGASGENDRPRLTFAEVEWSIANGDPADKPIGQPWVGDEDAIQKWGYSQGSRHRYGEYSGQENDPGELLLNTWKELQTLNDAITTYDFSVALIENVDGHDHEKVRLGDRVMGIDLQIQPPIEVESSIIEYNQNLNDDSLDEVVLGNFRTIYDSSGKIRNLEKVLERDQGKWDEKPNMEDLEDIAGGDFQGIQDEIDAATGRIEDAIVEIQLSKDRMDQAAIDIEANEDAIASGVIELDKANTDLTALRNRLTSSEGSITDLDNELGNAKDRITNAQNVIDSVTENVAGVTRLKGTLVTDRIIAQNATLTGTLTGSNAIFDNIGINNAVIKSADIQNATISGNIGANDAVFTRATIEHGIINHATMWDTTITGALYAKYATFNDGTFKKARIENADIVNATITGSLTTIGGTFTGKLEGVDGTFIGKIVGGSIESNTSIAVTTNLKVGDNITIGFGRNSLPTNKGIVFGESPYAASIIKSSLSRSLQFIGDRFYLMGDVEVRHDLLVQENLTVNGSLEVRNVGGFVNIPINWPWVAYGGTDAYPSVMKDPFGRVHLRGSYKGGRPNTAMSTLPLDYRPKKTQRFVVGIGGSTGFGQLTITTNGVVSIWGDSTLDFAKYVGIDGVSFFVD